MLEQIPIRFVKTGMDIQQTKHGMEQMVMTGRLACPLLQTIDVDRQTLGKTGGKP